MTYKFNNLRSLQKRLIDCKELINRKGNIIAFDGRAFFYGVYEGNQNRMFNEVWSYKI